MNSSFVYDDKDYTPIGFDINEFESDTILKFINGTFSFSGAIEFEDYPDSFRLSLSAKDFVVYSIWASDIDTGEEVSLRL